MCRAMEKIYNEIWAEAYAEGYAEGLAESAAEYAEKLAKLCDVLTKENRLDDVFRTANDPSFAKTLFRKFGI